MKTNSRVLLLVVVTASIFLLPSLYACGPGNNDNNNNNSDNHAPAAMVESDVSSPVNGAVYQLGDLVPIEFTAPADEDGDVLDVKVNVVVDDDGVAGKTAGDTSYTEELGSVNPSSEFSDVIDTAGIPVGVGEEVDVYADIVVSDGKGGESSLERMVTVQGASVNDVSCKVNRAEEGNGFTMNCAGTPNGETYSIDDSTLNGLTVSPTGFVGGPTMTSAEANGQIHSITVGYGDATTTAKFSVDPMRVEYVDCAGQTKLMTKSTVDRMTGCMQGINTALIDSLMAGDPEYRVNIHEAEFGCIQTELANAPSEEKEAWASGYDANPEADFAACGTGDQPQVVYTGTKQIN